ncbi:DNA/RNA nuclease SfsA [Alloalcanivorax mobilis]|uniref:DNA/RNA nuclease SfsA n=1 Tax=Alloalcanivorax mobilis TaxID=2019569 RepID=UPI000B5B287A|nr:DNA/RNA nuclease SfsA [Alloalcanivorax mobilis]ASK35181.1 DNA/RNA nuclease SfsA [Alcanivorax sp. N3-2A]|tara:strand:- start:17166 stop:17891 length:726 start_codon:yes stop_codon:yes gene_type:complete
MKFSPPLQAVTLLRRYKRFLADVRLTDGSEITVHCPNTGSMRHCVLPGVEQAALISDSGNASRKYRHTLEAVQVAHGHWAGVNTARTNALVAEALLAGRLDGLDPTIGVEREVTFGDSRFDLALGERGAPHTFIEVKNVTLGAGPDDPDDGMIRFPDSVTLRGQKHLLGLAEVVRQGGRAVLFFCVQHSGALAAGPAGHIDPVYARMLGDAAGAGVEIMAWKTRMAADEFVLDRPLPVVLS